jgi:hypothetical protein
VVRAPSLNTAELLRRRIAAQGLARPGFDSPAEVVEWFGAVQAQDYLGALWALGQRTRDATEASVEKALADRELIRCWPMRGTLHFVAAGDARWLTRLLAPRVIARNAARWKREFGIDARVISRSRDVILRGLEGGMRLERAALYELLEARRIATGNSRGLHILLIHALEGTLCLTNRSGKQHAFALLDEWIPTSREFEREDALAELARRYFRSHGPATLQDFTWWSGLTAADAKLAIDVAGRTLEHEELDGRSCWSGGEPARARVPRAPHVLLLPAYDEYTVAYKDRSSLVTAARKPLGAGFGLLSPVVVVDGQVVGNWARTLTKDAVGIAAKPRRALTRAEQVALRVAATRYAGFLGVSKVRAG